MREYRDGDIVEYRKWNGCQGCAVFLSCYADHAMALELYPRASENEDHKIMFRTGMHADASKVFYMKYNDVKVVGELGDDALADLIRHVGECIGIYGTKAAGAIEQAAEREAEPVDSDLSGAKDRKILKLKAERDAYKQLYLEAIRR